MRIKFYLEDFDEAFYRDFPCRININDFIYLDDLLPHEDSEIIDKKKNKVFGSATPIMFCVDVGFCRDSIGFYQQVYLSSKK